jgi:threonylcarbamoyladenosine tRNA methylthiotransferase MtaB
LGHYGLESGTAGLTLARLVRRIAELPGEFRLRISSVEATEITPELIRVVADYPGRICPHLHIPMQSGADAVLQLMRRRSSSREFVERCLAVAAALDQPALTTDAIVGFPGETEDDFAATCRVVEEIGFSKLHIFRFSPRQGTPAAEMPNPVQGRIQQRRAAELATLGRQLRQRYCKSLLGRRLQVLVEGAAADRPGVLLCTSDRYVPVEFAGAADLVWRLVDVTAVEAVEGRLRCEVRSHLPPVDG